MSEFNEIQVEIQKARQDREARRRAVFRSREKLHKLQREKQLMIRSVGRDTNAYQALLGRERDLNKTVAANDSRLAHILEAERTLLERFDRYTDPRSQLSRLSDEYPVLLFPVRLETRFNKIQQPGGGVQHQLWVRIFPDECSIDTFDDTLSETEVKKVRNYWVNRWKAGKAGHEDLAAFVQDKEKGAWRELMGIFNAGRAYWIKENYQPVNAADIPVRDSETDVILVIAGEELPDTATQDVLKAYWAAVFLANGNAAQVQTAFAALVTALGVSEEDTRQLAEAHQPQNIETELDETGPPPDVQVVFVQFPGADDVDTKLATWSQAARVTTLPERFVLLGYQAGIPEPVVQELGQLISDPLIVGPDPGMDINQVLSEVYGEAFEDLTEDEKAAKYIEYLSERSETQWLFDFEEAIQVGMGFKVDISQALYDQGLEHLFVLGVKLSADPGQGQSLLEELIKNHHFGDSGFSILPQGAATNNTEDSPSGYSESEDADQAYARYHGTAVPDDPSTETDKRDGRWLAELLGIDIENAALNLAAGYYQKDQCEARAMNTALWNATIGYFMETMLTPVFNEWQRNLIRWFFTNHVSGRGRLPAIRIGNQPYGILPISTVSDLGWLGQDDTRFAREYSSYWQVMNQIYTVLRKVRENWKGLVNQAAYVGKQGDAHTILLEALGLHPNSVEFDQRYAESFLHQYNWLRIYGVSDEQFAEFLEGAYKKSGMDLLEHLGYTHNQKLDPKIPILEKFFFTRKNDVAKPLIDDRELSETDKIRAYTDSGLNYVEWLIENAGDNHQNIRDQKGFSSNQAPYAILYDLLRHSLNLAFGNTGLNLYKNADILNEAQADAAREDADFIGIRTQPTQLESKWDLIYREDNRIAGDGILLVDYISSLLKTQIINSQTWHLHEVVNALANLKDAPTARLERVLVEHLDCCTYRLDAWLLGLVNLQLRAMRFGGVSNYEDPKQGIYLGAYGWLENLKPDDKTLEPVILTEDQKAIFDPTGDKQPTTDSTNAGYVHAPSINHALTAAVLRNAYISNASPEQAEPYKVNLSSERVRIALSMIEGIQQGQSFGALLGYQLERGLHDRTQENLDIYIYELRKEFSLVSNQMLPTQIRAGKIPTTPDEAKRFEEEKQEFEQDKAVTKIEARNVVNGLALLDHIRKTKIETYPFGLPLGQGPGKLKPAEPKQRDAINDEVKRLMNIRDAVADLAMAENVHQVVQGNYERAAGALDSYSKGSYPQLPDVVQSPGSGIGLTHRLGVHLPTGVVPDAGDTPRAKAEPAINKWLEDLFPDDLTKVACRVTYTLPDYEDAGPNPLVHKTVSVADLDLLPIDLLYMLTVESDKSLTALDDHILKFVHADDSPRPDVEMEIQYTHAFDPAENIVTFFELAPLIDNLRSVVVTARPLRSTDIALPNEAAEGQFGASTIERTRITEAKQAVDDIAALMQTHVIDGLTPLIDDEDFEITLGNKDAIIALIDAVVEHFIDHLHQLSQFGVPQSGFGFIFDRKSEIYAGVYRKVVDYKNRWLAKQAHYDDLINNQLPVAPTDEEKLVIMQEAERTISTQNTIPLPSISDYQDILDAKRDDFMDKLGDLQTFLGDEFLNLQDLVNEINTLKSGLGDFDLVKIETDEDEKQIVILAEDLLAQARKMDTALGEKSTAIQALLDQEAAAARPEEKVSLLTESAKAVFGEDFQIVPEFNLSAKQGQELQKSLDDQDQLLDYQTNGLSNDFPVDEWLYGVARVREKVAAWENLVMLAEGYKERSPLDLTPLQLPYVEDDHWLGLTFPEDYEITGDKLLYTAYLPAFSAGQAQCGLLVDEWTEVIPAQKETTGMTFHYDRPNSEPPQTMLLVTPGAFTGAWQWTDVVQTLHESLELAKLRAIEPDHVDKTAYAQFLPATVAAVTSFPVTMALNYLLASNQIFSTSGDDNG